MSNEGVQRHPPFEWKQNSLKFAISDLRRNWPRWLFWAAVFIGAIAIGVAATGPNPHPKYPPPDPRIYWPVIFLGALGVQFLSAIFLWDVEIGDGCVKLGYGRNSRYYHLKKVAHVGFVVSSKSPSMLVDLKSGRRIEIFVDSSRVDVAVLMRYFSSVGISVSSQES